MAHLIDKDALVAEIENRLAEISDVCQGYIADKKTAAEYNLLSELRDFLDTLETKEVDINKEISQFIDANFEKATIGHKLSLRRVAKHFFELGLKAQKGE